MIDGPAGVPKGIRNGHYGYKLSAASARDREAVPGELYPATPHAYSLASKLQN